MNTAIDSRAPAGPTLATADLEACLERQRAAYRAEPVPTLAARAEDLRRLKRMALDHRDAIADAISRDYGSRSRHETLLAEVLYVADAVDHALRHLRRWLRPRRRGTDWLLFPGARNRVIPQPLGVVGVIVPWNFPLQLALGPLVSIFAAGNRAMVKMSENSGELSRLLIRIAPDYFPAAKLQFFAETGGVGVHFSRLAFDHLLFTGSGATGRAVMAAAAHNLTPVTLELGGKSPAVIAADFPLDQAVERILYAKQFNSGQICIDVDYVFVPEGSETRFIETAREWVQRHCPDIHSEDYTAIIDARSFERLQAALDEAMAGGARLENLHRQPADPVRRKMPLVLALGTTPDMQLRRREIFGPILPLLTYREPGEVLAEIRRHDRPLAFYPFTRDRRLRDYYLENVMSGGVSVNDTLLHSTQHDLPFGGVGGSGMGHYHAEEGFLAFSKQRPVFYQARFSALKLLAPPYRGLSHRLLEALLRMRDR